VNKDAPINVDSLSDDIDFSLLLTRENFEKLIEDKIQLFKQELVNFIERVKKNYPHIDITNVEMAGELMRTPALERTVKEICKIEMSKTILTDECLSVGCSLYGALLQGTFPIQNFKGIYHLNHYTINASINDKPIEEFVSNHYQIPEFKSFTFDKNEMNNNINISFYHSKKEINDYSFNEGNDDNVLLVTYSVICSEILKKYPDMNQLKVTFLVDNIGQVHLNKLESIINNDNSAKIKLDTSIIKIVKRGLYLSQAQKNQIVAKLNYTEQNLFKIDQDFINFSTKKNGLESDFYSVKNLVQSKNLTNAQYNGKNIMTCLQEIEDQLNDNINKVVDLTPIEDYLDKIVQSITPSNIAKEKEKIMAELNNFQQIINGGKFDQKKKNDAENMIEYFKKKLHLIIDMQNLNGLYNELNKEKVKYF
jgi:molecular chaperone DnaK (HSP70)